MKRSILSARRGIALVVTIPVLEATAAATAVIDQRWPAAVEKAAAKKHKKHRRYKAATGTY
ncbi:hypothetical protein FJ930_21475 [Mesorhizobium sp. B2-4-15]|uniref:hypothetical protein n=1 Tax=Mesorhizobium sp. B2-4-15 TaxID=2589934 RepID=UPI00114DB437|nr:hypothetical protein [Mesorhizobium sp. B2-4-15]TPK69726.1 hypothetical protein FJ930_21475 [Mesorhizobium sp. B2-4-15]